MSLVSRVIATTAVGGQVESAAALASPVLPSLIGPTGLGTSAARLFAPQAPPPAETTSDGRVPPLYCPPAVRDDRALGDLVNERLVSWAEEIGIYPGRYEELRATSFGRLIMLAHPDCDDPDRLLAAAKCALAEWSVDDHYCDDESAGAVPELLPTRLEIACGTLDPVHLPEPYATELDETVRADPVLTALRDAWENLGSYATPQQVNRLRHELTATFLSFDHEASWRHAGRMPTVWEYLLHRELNSFLPCMTLIDALGCYELPAEIYAQPPVRRAIRIAGNASVLLNDLYSMAREEKEGQGFNLPVVIAAEENCSREEAIARSVEIHDELVHTFEAEAAVLGAAGPPVLARFLAGVWSWLGGNHEWHRSSGRYSADQPALEQ